MDVEATVAEIKLLSPQEHDIIMIRTDLGVPREVYAQLVASLRQYGFENLLLIMHDHSDIYMLDEESMRQFGWIRKEA